MGSCERERWDLGEPRGVRDMVNHVQTYAVWSTSVIPGISPRVASDTSHHVVSRSGRLPTRETDLIYVEVGDLNWRSYQCQN